MKDKCAILYYSKYGTTKKYAIKISEQLRCDIFDISKISVDLLKEYTSYIICTSLISGKLAIEEYLIKHAQLFSGKKKVLVYTYLDATSPRIDTKDSFAEDIPLFAKKACLDKAIHMKDLWYMMKDMKYYRQHPVLSSRLHQGYVDALESVDDVAAFCVEYLNVEIPAPLLR